MTKKEIEEISAKISTLQTALNGVQSEFDDIIKKMEKPDEVPEMLYFEDGEQMFFVNTTGIVIDDLEYYSGCFSDENKKHRLFKSSEMAEMFAEKSQFICDLLYFKQLYDCDYVPDWEDGERKYFVYFDNSDKCFATFFSEASNFMTVYFSSKKIAEKCADWLNSKRKKSDDAS